MYTMCPPYIYIYIWIMFLINYYHSVRYFTPRQMQAAGTKSCSYFFDPLAPGFVLLKLRQLTLLYFHFFFVCFFFVLSLNAGIYFFVSRLTSSFFTLAIPLDSLVLKTAEVVKFLLTNNQKYSLELSFSRPMVNSSANCNNVYVASDRKLTSPLTLSWLFQVLIVKPLVSAIIFYLTIIP